MESNSSCTTSTLPPTAANLNSSAMSLYSACVGRVVRVRGQGGMSVWAGHGE